MNNEKIKKYTKMFFLFKPFFYLFCLSKDERILIKKNKNVIVNKFIDKKTDFDYNNNSFEIINWSLIKNNEKVLDNINCCIQKKQITCVIGPNGSGKTTFLRSLNRMNDYKSNNIKTYGNIFFDEGINLYSPSLSQSCLTTKIGTITQKSTVFPLTIYDNIAYGPRNNGIKNKKILDKIVHDALDDVGLWNKLKNKLNSYPTDLSGGLQQQLCIARAIALKPEILLMDQPTGELDPIATNFIENLMLSLKNKYTIVIVTHSMKQAQRVSDNTFFFQSGKLIEQGRTKDIFMNPKQKETKDFILGRKNVYNYSK